MRPVPTSRDDPFFEEDILARLPDYSIQRFRVFLTPDHTRGVVEAILPLEEPDQSMIQLAAQLQKPVVISTERFGDLILNRSLGQFEGKAEWNRKPVKISIEKSDDHGIASELQTADHLWSAQADWKRKGDDFAVEKLLSLKNDSWLDEDADEPELTPDQFKSRMKLTSISIGKNGEFTFWHSDGNLFFGHWIEVRGDLKNGLNDSGIAG